MSDKPRALRWEAAIATALVLLGIILGASGYLWLAILRAGICR